MGESERRLAGAAAQLFDAARSLEYVSEKLETVAETQAAATDRLIDAIEKMGNGKTGGGSAKKDNGFKGFVAGVEDLVKALGKYDKMKDVGEKFVTFLTSFNKVDFKKIEAGGESLKSMAGGLAAFSLALAASTVIFAMAAIGSVIVVPMIAGYAYLFYQLGRASKEIDAGANAMKHMAIGLGAFALGIFAVKQLAGGDWAEFAKGSLIVLAGIAVFTGAFYLVGKVAAEVEAGAKALAWSGIALATLALGIAAFGLLKIDMASVLMAGAAIAVTGLSFALVGLASGYIEAGAVAVAFAGISLAVLALGLAAFRLLGMTFEEALTTVGIVGTVSAVFAAAGFAAPFVFLGAAAVLVAGAAMAVLSLGLFTLNKVYSGAMNGLFAKSSIDSTKTNLDVVIGSVVESFYINPLKSALMLAGAASLMVASIALVTLSAGVAAFNWAFNKAKDGIFARSEQDPNTTNIDVAITGIVSAFNINPIKSAFMLVGAAALLVASAAMITMSLGIVTFNWAFKKVKDSGLFGPSSMDPKVSNFEHMMNSLSSGLVIGPLMLVGLYAAVPAWIMAGAALFTIGAGVAKFADLVEKKIDIDRIGTMVNKVLTAVIDVFIGVGSGKLVDWDDVEDGISAVSDVGNIVNGIATGVAKMAELKFPMYDAQGNITGYFTVADKQFDMVAKNMKLIINAVAGTLVEIGKSQGETGWFSKSAGEKGADAIRGVGQDLVGLADFVQKAANLTFPIYDKDGKQVGVTTLDPAMLDKGGSVYSNIVRMIKAVSGALGEIGSGEAAQSGWFSDSDIEKGKAAIQGVAGDLNGIAAMVQSVAQIGDIKTVEDNIRRILKVVPEAMVSSAAILDKNKAAIGKTGEMSSSFGAFLQKMAESADPITKLSNSLEKISKTMSKFSDTFKSMKLDAVAKFDNLISSLVTFSKVDPRAFDSLGNRAQELYKYVYEKNDRSVKAPTAPTPSNAITASPGNTPLPAAKPTASSSKANEAQAAQMQMMQQMFQELSANMASFASSMKRLEAIMSGTLKVQNI